MNSKLPYYILLTSLLGAGLWGLLQLHGGKTTTQPATAVADLDQPVKHTYYQAHSDDKPKTDDSLLTGETSLDHQKIISEMLSNADFRSAANYINEHYSRFSSSEIEQLKALFLQNGPRSELRINQLRAATQVFDDLESWDALATAALDLGKWQLAFEALMKASALENNYSALELKLENLINVTSYLRANLEALGDEVGIRDLYQKVYELHPSYPRFQLELAYAHLRVNETSKAERLLSALQYDPELGEIAQQTLARIEDGDTPIVAEKPAKTATTRRDDIVVPLIRAGNSFFLDSTVNNRRTRLLLDTGASITALSSGLIEQLDLRPTGQVIKLNTANGTRQARLFKTEKLTLGRIQLNDLVIAEIGLGSNSGFEGLLGTDALNQVDGNYSYLIDNNENALIFRRR